MIAIIPARSGSKGLQNKNIKEFSGKPLIAWTIEVAQKSHFINEIIVSTDSEEIYDIGIEYGANKTFLRPLKLAQDNSLAIDTYIYTINRLEKETNVSIDSFVVLLPTSPLRVLEDVNGAIDLFYQKKADSVISYCEEHHPITWHKYIDENLKFKSIFKEDLKNRQDYKKSFYPNGSIFIFNKTIIEQRRYYTDNSYGYIMPRNRSIDIDTIDDFLYAEYLLKLRN